MRLSFEAIGTVWQIDLPKSSLATAIAARIVTFDEAYSRFNPGSLVTQMAQRAGTYALPADGFHLLQFYEKLYDATDGAVTPLIGQTMVDAGYDTAYSLRPKRLRQPPAWRDVISYTKHEITMLRPALLDFGAAGKGYLVDLIGELLTAHGVQEYTIDAGGDILHHSLSRQAISVGLENPYNTNEVIGTIDISNQSLCASAGNRRAWAGYTHIIDPRSLQSPPRVQASWVVAPRAMVSDGLATALFFTNAARLRQDFSFEYGLLDSDLLLESSPNFPVHAFRDGAR